MATSSAKWSELLSLTLLDIRNTIKDSQYSPAGFVYDTSTCFPGDMFNSTAPNDTDLSSFAALLEDYVRRVQPCARRCFSLNITFCELSSCPFVLVCVDGTRKPLHSYWYDEPNRAFPCGQVFYCLS